MLNRDAGISGTSAQCDLTNTTNCNIPNTPAFGPIINATTGGTNNKPVPGKFYT